MDMSVVLALGITSSHSSFMCSSSSSSFLKLVKILLPRKTILTNMHSDIDYDKIKKKLPKNIIPGYDGMTVKL